MKTNGLKKEFLINKSNVKEGVFQMKRYIVNIVLSLIVFNAFAQENVDVKRSTGVASAYRDAIKEALISALEQYNGMSLSSSNRSQILSLETSVSVQDNGGGAEKSKRIMSDALIKSMQKFAKGRILGYDIVSESFDSNVKQHTVTLDVRFAGRYVVGRDPNNLRRMAINNFRVNIDTYNWKGVSRQKTSKWRDLFADRLNEYITQTRKFTVLDRKFDAEVDAELARILDENANPRDLARLNNKLATDYLITGSLIFSDVLRPSEDLLSGAHRRVKGVPFVTVSYRVLLAPTGQVKWANSITVNVDDFALVNVEDFILRTTNFAAKEVSSSIMDVILPLEVVGRTKSGLIVIGEGGERVSEGEIYTVYNLGEEVVDTRTGECLDRIEEPVGDVQIMRVVPKCSYAKVVSGSITAMTVGSQLRRSSKISNVQKEKPCEQCRGEGFRSFKVKCKDCEGSGRVGVKIICDRCNGSRKVTCHGCGGAGVVANNRRVSAGIGGHRMVRSATMACKTCSGRRLIQCPQCRNRRYKYEDCTRCNTKGFELKKQVCASCKGSGIADVGSEAGDKYKVK